MSPPSFRCSKRNITAPRHRTCELLLHQAVHELSNLIQPTRLTEVGGNSNNRAGLRAQEQHNCMSLCLASTHKQLARNEHTDQLLLSHVGVKSASMMTIPCHYSRQTQQHCMSNAVVSDCFWLVYGR